MTKDPVDYVRQGAFISLAMILIQQNDTTNTKVSSTRKLYEKIINDKHEDAMAKFGAVLGQGIIDAGIHMLKKIKFLISIIIEFFFFNFICIFVFRGKKCHHILTIKDWSFKYASYCWDGRIYTILVLVPIDTLSQFITNSYSDYWIK